MDKIKISGIPVYDGEYDLDTDRPFTNRELHIFKRVAGVRAGEIEAAFAAGDNDMLVAVAIIALTRHGKRVDEDLIWDAPNGGIDLIEEEAPQAADAGPPALTPTEPAAGANENGNADSSGDSSKPDGDHQESSLRAIGSPDSDTSATSARATSAT